MPSAFTNATLTKTAACALAASGLFFFVASNARPQTQSGSVPKTPKWNGGRWGAWQPLPAKAGVYKVDYSFQEKTLYLNGHGEWDGRFRNRYDQPVRLRLVCTIVNHRGDNWDESPFSITIPARSVLLKKDVVYLSYAPIKPRLMAIAYDSKHGSPQPMR